MGIIGSKQRQVQKLFKNSNVNIRSADVDSLWVTYAGKGKTSLVKDEAKKFLIHFASATNFQYESESQFDTLISILDIDNSGYLKKDQFKRLFVTAAGRAKVTNLSDSLRSVPTIQEDDIQAVPDTTAVKSNKSISSSSSTPSSTTSSTTTKKPKPKPVSQFDQNRLGELFEKYRDMRCSTPMINFDGLSELCADWGVDPDDPILFALSFLCNAQNLGFLTKAEWMNGFCKSEMKIDTIDKLKDKTTYIRDQIEAQFPEFWNWLYDYCKENTARLLDKGTAIDMWELFIKDKFSFYDEWVAYVNKENTGISRDTWDQFRLFIDYCKTDPKLDNYSTDGVWSFYIDSFYDFLVKKGSVVKKEEEKGEDNDSEEDRDYDYY